MKDEPVLTMGPEPYDKAAVAFDQIFKRDGVYYAVYHANSERPWKDWTTCIARWRRPDPLGKICRKSDC